MKFMLLLTGNQTAETGAAPSEELMTAMNAFNEALTSAGAWVEANGLQPTSEGFRVLNEGGEITLTNGPFTDRASVLFGYWVIQVASQDEAIGWARRVPFEAGGASSENGRIEVRQIQELDDFPIGEDESGWREREEELRAVPIRAETAPGKVRYLMVFLANKQSEAGELPDEKLLTEMGDFIGELAANGTWVSGEGLHPSSAGARVEYQGGKRTVLDGPFAETKELVAGFGVVEVDSRAQAEEIARQGAKINGDGVSEIRKLF
jgi:hypothetical protein